MSREIVEKKVQTISEPKKRLAQKAYLNAVAAVLDNTARVAVAFIITPILVAGLGNMLFGVWQILHRLVSQISAADGRPTQALKWVIANSQASDDHARKRREIGSAFGVWLLFLPVLSIAGIIIVWFSPAITKVPQELSLVTRVACALLVVNFILAGLFALPEAVLRGMNLGYKRMGLVAGISIIGGILTAGAIYYGLGLTGVAGAQVIVSFGFTRPRFSEVRRFLKLSIWYSLWTLTNKLLTASDMIILGVISSALAVTTYTLTGYAAIIVVEFIFVAIEATTPGLGGMIGQKQYDRAAEIRKEMMILSWLLVTAIGATILLWNRSFIHLWVGPEHYAGLWANVLIVLVVVQWVFFRIDAYIIDLTLDLRHKVILGIISAVLSVGLAALLIPRLGIVGLCFGLMGGRLVLTVSYPWIVSSFLGESARVRVNSFFRPALIMGLLFICTAYLSQRVIVENWAEWILYVGMSFGCIITTGFIAGFNPYQKKQLIGRLKNLQFFKQGVS
jgi:O-antigen/teichoic acid export membrane protein